MMNSSAPRSTTPLEEAIAAAVVLNRLGIAVSDESLQALVTSGYRARKEAERPQRLADTENALKGAYSVASECTPDQISVTRSVDNCLFTETTKVKFYGDVLTVERRYSAGGNMNSYRVSICQESENTVGAREFSGSVGSSDFNREYVGRFLQEIDEMLKMKLRGKAVVGDLRLKLLAEHIESATDGS